MQKVPNGDTKNAIYDQYKVDLIEDLDANRKSQPPQFAFITLSKPPRLIPTNFQYCWHIKKPLHTAKIKIL